MPVILSTHLVFVLDMCRLHTSTDECGYSCCRTLIKTEGSIITCLWANVYMNKNLPENIISFYFHLCNLMFVPFCLWRKFLDSSVLFGLFFPLLSHLFHYPATDRFLIFLKIFLNRLQMFESNISVFKNPLKC